MISCSAVHTYIKCMLPECRSDVDDLEQKKWKFPVGGRSVCLSPLSLLTVCCHTSIFLARSALSVLVLLPQVERDDQRASFLLQHKHSLTHREGLLNHIHCNWIDAQVKRDDFFNPLYSCREFTVVVCSVW
jgi:hypothetical protein